MGMISSSGLTAFQEQGEYCNLAEISRSAEPTAVSGEWALTLARLEIDAGRINSARRWLDVALAKTNQPDVVQLECAVVGVLAELDLEGAAKAIAKYRDDGRDQDPEISLLIIQLEQALNIYGELSDQRVKNNVGRLTAIGHALVQSGKLRQAQSARLQFARAADDQTTALLNLAQEWQNKQNYLYAADCYVLVAESAIKDSIYTDENISEWLSTSLRFYRSLQNKIGPIDINRVECELMLKRLNMGLEHLEKIADRYIEACYPKGAIAVYSSLVTEARRLGEMNKMHLYRECLEKKEQNSGLTMARKQRVIGEVDISMVEGRHAEALDLVEEALAGQLPKMLEASLIALRGNAKAFAGLRI